MTIYIDVVFFENVLVNYFLLELTGIFAKKKRNFFRLIFSSFVGSLFSILSLVVSLGLLESIIFKVFVSICMILIAFGKEKGNFIKIMTFFYLVTFVFGGISFMMIYFNGGLVSLRGGVLIGEFSLLKFLSALFVSICFLKVVAFVIKSRIEKKNLVCDLEIVLNNKKAKIKVLMDTGNLLREPFTGKPVVIVEKDALKPIFDVDILNNLDEMLDGNFISGDGLKFRIIPYSSLGNESGVIIGVCVDLIRIFWESEVVLKDAVVGIYEKRLSEYGGYSGLVGLEILNV